MNDLEDKKAFNSEEMGGSFSELMKKVVEQQLEESPETSFEEDSAVDEDIEIETEREPIKETVGEIVKNLKFEEVSAFDWEQKQKPEQEENFQAVSEVGVISIDTSINGTVSSKGHIRVEGNVIGDVFAYGDVKITGKVAGDIDGTNIECEACTVNGDIKARGDVSVGQDSILTGDINGQVITLDGKVQGNVEAQKAAHMSSTSIIRGSIAAPTLSMSTGAELQGKVDVSSVEKK